jgi:hypothetical protein
MAVVAGPRAVVAARVAGKGVLLLQDLRPFAVCRHFGQFIPDFLHLVFRGRYWKLSLFGQTLPKGAASILTQLAMIMGLGIRRPARKPARRLRAEHLPQAVGVVEVHRWGGRNARE